VIIAATLFMLYGQVVAKSFHFVLYNATIINSHCYKILKANKFKTLAKKYVYRG